MGELMQANWVLLVIALLIGVLVAWWVLVASRRTLVEVEEKDDSAPARRNQALIDAAPAVRRDDAAVQPAPLPVAAAEMPLASAPVEDVPAAMFEPSLTPSAAGEPAAPAAGPSAGPAVSGTADDLSRIKGLGPKLKMQLEQLGITRLDQVAAWDDADIDRVDAQLGRFQGRIRRDDWVGQARLLSAGDTSAYEERYGRT